MSIYEIGGFNDINNKDWNMATISEINNAYGVFKKVPSPKNNITQVKRLVSSFEQEPYNLDISNKSTELSRKENESNNKIINNGTIGELKIYYTNNITVKKESLLATIFNIFGISN